MKNSVLVPIVNEDEIKKLLRQAVRERKPNGARKIGDILKYHEAHLRNMFTRCPVSVEVAEFLGYEKLTLYVRKDIMQDPCQMNLLFSGEGLRQEERHE